MIEEKQYFLSYQNGDEVLILHLKGHDFDRVVIQSENPNTTRQCHLGSLFHAQIENVIHDVQKVMSEGIQIEKSGTNG